ncbi:DEAD/DEAH box helicase [Pararhizobium sp.]|uniref:DEAD/DEAH box helicase n=1 Tax=Pararhizobium sp. TaxID=1977563 RepID=UPI003D128CF8
MQEALSRGVVSGSSGETIVHADVFLAELEVLREIRSVFSESLEIGENLKAHLQSMAKDRHEREAIISANVATEDSQALVLELHSAGFKRPLRDFQLGNLSRVLLLPHAADFSVPGAGKTTVALAAFAIRRYRKLADKLLVVAPIAAFEAWKEEAVACFDVPPRVCIYGGQETFIPSATEILVSNYNRVADNYDVIRDYVSSSRTQVLLDEAHRVKKGAAGSHGRAALDLAYAASRRDVLTGTPAPQGAHDLVALVKFLYPGQDRQILPHSAYFERLGRDQTVLEDTHAALSRYFVRTPKSALNLPRTKFNFVARDMPPIQAALYDALVGRYKGEFSIDDRKRHNMQRLGRITMYLLEAATNPMLLTSGSDTFDDPAFEHPPLEVNGEEKLMDLLQNYSRFELPWKYKEVESIVSAAASRGEKVLIWTNFVRNIRILSRILHRYSPAIVHGGVPSSASALPSKTGTVTRELEFNRFRFDPSCTVLLANPAACGEGVSLHHWCHHAVYLDRSFNAGHFLQSQDRIHRLGLSEDSLTQFTVLVSNQTIDNTVDSRLTDKVRALSVLMNDPGLVQIALPASDEGEGGQATFTDDYSAVRAHVSDHNARTS